jgi:hypothetical protein
VQQTINSVVFRIARLAQANVWSRSGVRFLARVVTDPYEEETT